MANARRSRSADGAAASRSKVSDSASRSTRLVLQPAACQARAWLWPPLVWFAHYGRWIRAELGKANPSRDSMSATWRANDGPRERRGAGTGPHTCRARQLLGRDVLSRTASQGLTVVLTLSGDAAVRKPGPARCKGGRVPHGPCAAVGFRGPCGSPKAGRATSTAPPPARRSGGAAASGRSGAGRRDAAPWHSPCGSRSRSADTAGRRRPFPHPGPPWRQSTRR